MSIVSKMSREIASKDALGVALIPSIREGINNSVETMNPTAEGDPNPVFRCERFRLEITSALRTSPVELIITEDIHENSLDLSRFTPGAV